MLKRFTILLSSRFEGKNLYIENEVNTFCPVCVIITVE
jgi:hypothetical protein